jgi:Cell wall binding domain 2 (CWB2)
VVAVAAAVVAISLQATLAAMPIAHSSSPPTRAAVTAGKHTTVGALGLDAPRGRSGIYCDSCTPPLIYGGGKVMGTAARPGDTTVYSVYWAPSAASYSANYETIIDGFLRNVASASGSTTNVFSVLTQYHGTSATPVAYNVHFGGHLDDTTAFPASGCPVLTGYTTCLTDVQIQAEVTKLITAQALPVSSAHIYSVFLPPGVDTCDSPGSCNSNAFCGYHSAMTVNGAQVVYSNEPYPNLTGCNTGQSPNGNAWADTAIKTESHELNEAITDPFGDGWADAAGNENGDECSQNYGAALGSTNAAAPSTTKYNQVIGTGKYYIQTEFSDSDYAANKANGCVLALGAAPQPNVNLVAMTDDTTSVPNDGTTTDNVYAQVTKGGSPVVGDTVTFTVGSTGGTCGPVTTTAASTDAGGYAYAYYTASAGNLACTVIANESGTGQSGLISIANGTPPAPAHSDRIAGSGAVTAAIATSMQSFPTAGSADTAVLGSDADRKGALAGAPLAVADHGPLLLTGADTLNKKVAAELTRAVRPGADVYLLGDSTVLSDAIATSVSGLGFVPVRIAGGDADSTAVGVANELGSPDVVVETDGTQLADILLAATVAAREHGALLLTDGTTQSPDTAAYLEAHPGTDYAIGKEAAAADPNADAVVGDDAADLAAEVADQFFGTATTVGILSKERLDDAIGGAAQIGALNAPFLFADANSLPEFTTAELQALADTLTNVLVYADSTDVSNQVLGYIQENG